MSAVIEQLAERMNAHDLDGAIRLIHPHYRSEQVGVALVGQPYRRGSLRHAGRGDLRSAGRPRITGARIYMAMVEHESGDIAQAVQKESGLPPKE